jgi:colanic acid/amylovoran biosynthesis glycosyltransferase
LGESAAGERLPRIAWAVDQFPALSERFVLRQVTGLIDRGFDVRIVSRTRGAEGVDHPDVTRYGLMERTHFLPPVPGGAWGPRPVAALRAAGSDGVGGLMDLGWSVTRGASPRWFGGRAATLRPYFEGRWWRSLPRFDVVVANFGTLGAAIEAYCRRGDCRAGALVTFFRGHDVGRLQRGDPRRYAELFRGGDRFFAVSRDLVDRLIGHGYPGERLRVLRGGIELAEFGAVAAPRRGPGEPTRFVSACRLVEKKGIEVALRALASLAGRGGAWAYEVVGDGPARAGLEALSVRLGVADRVRWSGWRDRDGVRAAVAGAHVLLSPSVTTGRGDIEGLANIVKEAMAMRRPVIATRHGGTAEAVADGVSGRLVAERDVAGLADAAAALMDRPGDWAAMGDAGRAAAERMFDLERLNDELASELRALVARTRAAGGGGA